MTTPIDGITPKVEQPTKLYSISLAAKAVGVSQRQLYYWEYIGIVKPNYEQFGSYSYRRYSQDDIEFLIKIRSLLNDGYTLRAAVHKVTGVHLGNGDRYAGSKLHKE